MNPMWDRVEPNSTDETLLEGMQARIADPLWMLARQWQMGEFDGEDAATPMRVIALTQSMKMSHFQTRDSGPQPLPEATPLEPVIEAITPDPRSAEEIASFNVAAAALLEELGFEAAQVMPRLRAAYPVRVERFLPDHPVPMAAQRRLRILSRRAFNPRALLREEGQTVLTAAPDLRAWVQAFVDMCRGRGIAVAGETDAYLPRKLSYGATVTAQAGQERVDMTLSDYGGGRLDWYSFDVDQSVAAEAGEAEQMERATHDGLPAQLSYAGQPLSRHWEFEDAEVHYGQIDAGPGDIARMIVADFAAIGGDDTFVLPIKTPVGAMSRVQALYVIDSFATKESTAALSAESPIDPQALPPHTHAILSAEATDRAANGDKAPPFRLFALEGQEVPTGQVGPWVPVFPVTANAMNGKALENVILRRDEAANLAWAIETQIEGPFGRPITRRQAWEIDTPEQDDPDAPWPYKLQTAVPPWWVPLVPERINDAGQMRLRRGRLGIWETMDPSVCGPKSRLMDPSKPVRLDEASVPASGVRMSRHWQVARGYDGRVILWQSWNRVFGASERPSDLSFDKIARRWT